MNASVIIMICEFRHHFCVSKRYSNIEMAIVYYETLLKRFFFVDRQVNEQMITFPYVLRSIRFVLVQFK